MTKVVFQFSGKMIEYLINDADRIGYHHRKTEVITRLHRYKNKSKKKNPEGLKT